MTAQFIGVGVGPGDPELITLKAARFIQSANVIAYIANAKGESQARAIASEILAQRHSKPREIPVVMPMCDDRSMANTVYTQVANDIQLALNAGEVVVFLCEGDPLFFASFAYLLERLKQNNRCLVVPGISSIHAASSALQLPLTMLKESFAVASGRHTLEHLVGALEQHDSVVIMKAGRSREKIIKALQQSKRLHEASYLEYIGRDEEKILRDIHQLDANTGPYFSLFVVVKQERHLS